jgi:glycosyltransferase involved in cell wall biosynthesis
MNKPLLTIAIPFYNGFETTKLILNELFSSVESNYEILISDDFSSESQSTNLVSYIEKKFNQSNIRYYRNSCNLGMDMNFQKCIELSNAEYTWFMGQDDFIYKTKLFKAIEYLKKFIPNVVYLNYEVKRTWNYNTKFVHTKNLEVVHGNNVDDFHVASRGNLPHFLPSLIVKTKLWPHKEMLSVFADTYFIQLGAFLSILAIHNNWLYIGEPMSIGLIPDDGWQSSIEKKIRIYAGFMICIKKSYELHPVLINIYNYQYFKNYYQHLSLSIEGKLSANKELLEILKSKSIFTKSYSRITRLIEYTPNMILKCFIFTRKCYFALTHLRNNLKK